VSMVVCGCLFVICLFACLCEILLGLVKYTAFDAILSTRRL